VALQERVAHGRHRVDGADDAEDERARDERA